MLRQVCSSGISLSHKACIHSVGSDRSIFMAGGSISTVERSISTIGGPGRGISTIGRSISIKAYPPGRYKIINQVFPFKRK